jgi:hypothetical protein
MRQGQITFGEITMSENTTPAFNSGRLLSTPGALEVFERNDQTPFEFLHRHLAKDWGDICEEDRQINEQSLIDGDRLFSSYSLKDGTKIWCITEPAGENGHREATTFLLPEEY